MSTATATRDQLGGRTLFFKVASGSTSEVALAVHASGRQLAEMPEAISRGRTMEEAKANVTEALELALEWRREEGEPLPERAQVTVTPVTITGS